MVYIVAVTVAVFAAVFAIGVLVQKAPSKVVRTVNWIAFGVAIVGGLASFALEQEVYRYIFFVGLVVYFLTIKYRTE